MTDGSTDLNICFPNEISHENTIYCFLLHISHLMAKMRGVGGKLEGSKRIFQLNILECRKPNETHLIINKSLAIE